MKRFVAVAVLVMLFSACSPDSQPVSQDQPVPVPSGSVESGPGAVGQPVVVVPADKQVSSQPAEKCPPVVKKAVAKKHAKKIVVVKKVKKHRKAGAVVVVPKACDCPKPSAVAPVPAPVPGPSQVEKQPYQYWLHGEKDPVVVPPVGESEMDRCTRTGGWWNTAVPYCERQMP